MAPAYPTAQYVHWQPAGKLFAAELRFDVVDTLNREVMEAFRAVPVRGAETGGLLLGYVERAANTVVYIQGRIPVPCSYAYGPSYRLTPDEESRLAEIIEQPRGANGQLSIVGLYRSHTRTDLSLTAYDLALWENYLPAPDGLFLLVKPFAARPGTGGIFFRERGQVRETKSYLEFPFQRPEAGGDPEEPASPEESQAESLPGERARGANTATLALVPPKPALEHRSSYPEPEMFDGFAPVPEVKPACWPRLALPGFVVAGALLVFGFAGAGILSLPLERNRKTPPARAYSLGLQAIENGNQVKVRWDRKSPFIAQAKRGNLSITDGAFMKDLELDGPELHNGSLSYACLTAKVNFRLEVFADNQTSVSQILTFTGRGAQQKPADSAQATMNNAAAPIKTIFPYLSIPAEGRQPVVSAAPERPQMSATKRPRRVQSPAWRSVPAQLANINKEVTPAAPEFEISRPAPRR